MSISVSLSQFSGHHLFSLSSGVFNSASFSSFLSVRVSNSLPNTVLGFGTGHSLLWLANSSASSSNIWNISISSSRTVRAMISFLLSGFPSKWPFFGLGQGKTCGIPTTTNEARRVAPKRVEVAADRGCRCGGMVKIEIEAWKRGTSFAIVTFCATC